MGKTDGEKNTGAPQTQGICRGKIQYLLEVTVKQPLKNRQNKELNDKW